MAEKRIKTVIKRLPGKRIRVQKRPNSRNGAFKRYRKRAFPKNLPGTVVSRGRLRGHRARFIHRKTP